jgi:formylglycine-generating enzyme required for sulfatase activity
MGQYGRIGKRRSGSGTWQWMVLGFFPGILCGGVLVFAMFASGALNSLTASVPTQQTPAVIIATNPPPTFTFTPGVTPTVLAPTATEEATAGAIDMAAVVQPSATPITLVSATASGSTGGTFGATATPLAGAEAVDATLNAPSNSAIQVQTVQGAPTVSAELAALQSVESAMITIPGGTFTMGTTRQEVVQAVDECVNRDGGNCQESFGTDSNPQFQVQLDAYQMEKTEVSFAQYLAFLTYLHSIGKTHKDACPSPNGASNLCIQTTNEVPGQEGQVGSGAVFTFDSINYNVNAALLPYPVYGVTWAGAQAYCEALGRRLPTEAEWEYAAKGNDPGRIYPWGKDWVETNAKVRTDSGTVGMVQIGSFPAGATPNGLLDMAGNVEEWVADWYGETYYSDLANQPQPVKNPQGPVSGIYKVLRGGSWDTRPFFARTVHRRNEFPAPDGNSAAFPRTIGFRCAANVGSDAPVSNGNVNPAALGQNVPTATLASSGAEGTALPGDGKRG